MTYSIVTRKSILHKCQLLPLLLMVTSLATAAHNLQIDGVLVSEPCTLDAKNNDLTVDFGSVIKKGLYKDKRTPPVPFTVTLTDCNTDFGKTVNLTFTGSESKVMPGYLQTTGVGSVGVVIGIETPEGIHLPVRQATPKFALQKGTTEIQLQAYIEAEPDAINQQTIVPGDFSATATLDVSYP